MLPVWANSIAIGVTFDSDTFLVPRSKCRTPTTVMFLLFLLVEDFSADLFLRPGSILRLLLFERSLLLFVADLAALA